MTSAPRPAFPPPTHPAAPTAGRRGRPGRRLALVALVFFALPLLEIAAIVGTGRVIGTWPTIALLVVMSAVGAWLVRREGAAAWLALRDAVQTGRPPAREITDAALVLVGGALLLTPGFVTDAAGLLLILPVTRPLTRRWLLAAAERQLIQRTGVVRGEAVPPRP